MSNWFAKLNKKHHISYQKNNNYDIKLRFIYILKKIKNGELNLRIIQKIRNINGYTKLDLIKFDFLFHSKNQKFIIILK